MNAIALIGALGSWPWRLLLALLFCLTVFIAGFVIGQRHVQQAWSTERLQQQAKNLKQSLQVAQLQTQQERINLKISTDYETQKSMLERRAPVLRDGALSLCHPASSPAAPVPSNAEHACSADGVTANLVPDPTRYAEVISCEQLVRDATDTTLMLFAIQKWYQSNVEILNGLENINGVKNID